MASFADVTAAVLEERRYQDYKWGNLNEHPHDLSTWLCLVNKKLRWAVDSFFGHDDREVVLSTLVEAVALGVAALEQHGIATPKHGSYPDHDMPGIWHAAKRLWPGLPREVEIYYKKGLAKTEEGFRMEWDIKDNKLWVTMDENITIRELVRPYIP